MKEEFPYYNPDESVEKKIERLFGPNADPNDPRVKAFREDAEHLRDSWKTGWRPETKPTREQIEAFVITPEKWEGGLKFASAHIGPLITAAAFNRDNAISYREFKVGCAVVGIRPQMPNEEYVVWQGYNFKPQPGYQEGKDERCAERNVLDAAQSELKVICALATFSKESSTGDPTKAHDVLHPCKDCRAMFRQLLQIGFLREDTLIVNANDSGKQIIFKEMTLKELLELYKDDVL